jgi:hypothetical protein
MVWNFLQFQLAWFACVLGASAGYASLGALAAVLLAAIHVLRQSERTRESMLVLASAGLGFLLDTFAVRMEWVRFTGAAGVAPLWIVALWLAFATTFNHSLGWLRARLWLAAVLGAFGGPLAYYSGDKLGALELTSSPAAYAGIAANWALAMPLLLQLAVRLRRGSRPAVLASEIVP